MSAARVMTDHAILRWLERVEGVDLDPIVGMYVEQRGETPVEWQLLDFVEQITGLTRDDIERSVLTPAMRVAARCGASRFRCGNRHAMIVRDGRVITVAPTGVVPRSGQTRNQRKDRRRKPRRGRIYEMMEDADV